MPHILWSGCSRAFLCTGAEVGGGHVQVSKPHGVLSRNFRAGGPEKGQRRFRGVNRDWPGLEVWLGSARGHQSWMEEVTVKHVKLCPCRTDHSPVLARSLFSLVLAITKVAGANAFVHVAVFPTILV